MNKPQDKKARLLQQPDSSLARARTRAPLDPSIPSRSRRRKWRSRSRRADLQRSARPTPPRRAAATLWPRDNWTDAFAEPVGRGARENLIRIVASLGAIGAHFRARPETRGWNCPTRRVITPECERLFHWIGRSAPGRCCFERLVLRLELIGDFFLIRADF